MLKMEVFRASGFKRFDERRRIDDDDDNDDQNVLDFVENFVVYTRVFH